MSSYVVLFFTHSVPRLAAFNITEIIKVKERNQVRILYIHGVRVRTGIRVTKAPGNLEQQKKLTGVVKGYSEWDNINPLKTKRICFIEGLSAYRAVNTLHFGYKNQSLNVL
jgi:hypothetical protein